MGKTRPLQFAAIASESKGSVSRPRPDPLASTPRTYRVERLSRRPWALVRDPEGFLDSVILAYLTCAAWQDASQTQVRADARWLARAASWMSSQFAWADLDLDAWTVFLQDVAVDCLLDGQVPQRAAFQAVHALHRAYAFWHWADPIRFHCQPFPTTPGERQRWVALILGERSALS